VLKAMISVPEDATGVSIDRDGEVRVVTAGSQGAESVGRLELARVRDVATLTSIEGGLYRPDQAAEILGTTPEEGGGTILQGSIELSNVELTDEMVMLMMTQRAYAASAQIVQAGDQLMGIANSLKR
jgi:flagellar basal-body rod protein FlgG